MAGGGGIIAAIYIDSHSAMVMTSRAFRCRRGCRRCRSATSRLTPGGRRRRVSPVAGEQCLHGQWVQVLRDRRHDLVEVGDFAGVGELFGEQESLAARVERPECTGGDALPDAGGCDTEMGSGVDRFRVVDQCRDADVAVESCDGRGGAVAGESGFVEDTGVVFGQFGYDRVAEARLGI
ncbi:hypothetical protein ACWDUD_30265 [Rhodococcus sp. NPDC003382]